MTEAEYRECIGEVLLPKYHKILEEASDEHEFSPKFQKRMDKLIRQRKKPYYRFVNTFGKRVAVFIVMFLIASVTTVMSVEALRRPVIDFFKRVFSAHSNITVDSVNDSSAPNTIEHKYEITVDLSDYRIVYSYSNNAKIYNEYVNGKTVISFAQSIMGDFNKDYNTEDAIIENIYIDGYDTTAFLDNRGFYTLIWNNGEYVFELSSNIGKDALIEIAQSVQKVE